MGFAAACHHVQGYLLFTKQLQQGIDIVWLLMGLSLAAGQECCRIEALTFGPQCQGEVPHDISDSSTSSLQSFDAAVWQHCCRSSMSIMIRVHAHCQAFSSTVLSLLMPSRPGQSCMPSTWLCFRVHVDYTVRSGPGRLHQLLPDEADTLKRTPFAVIQVGAMLAQDS